VQPPVIETYVVWHPEDRIGEAIADQLVDHFHGTAFTGLVGGAMEIYVRSHGWRFPADAPRPIPVPSRPPPRGLGQALLTAVVPVIGTELAAAVQHRNGAWFDYLTELVKARNQHPERVGIFPLVTDPAAAHGTALADILGRFHGVGRGRSAPDEPVSERRCRDLAQGIAQFLGGLSGSSDGRLTVFISHTTKVGDDDEPGEMADLVAQVRAVVGQTRLNDFFSTNALRVGHDWSSELTAHAATSALLALRTDLYASRPWCQREMLVAKCAGMPVIMLDALGYGEERGSFLMDHVPRVHVRRDTEGWRAADIRRGLNLLVDECLKRALWRHQRRDRPDVEWWAPHAPEPATLLHWLHERLETGGLPTDRPVRIIHPDPPLGPDERLVLDQLTRFGGLEHPLDILTPRSLAARGG
jgi:hypothetical protein